MGFCYPAYKERMQDGRVKLTDEDREHIRHLHASGEGIRSIARRYEDKCSRRLVQFVIFPDRVKKLAETVKKEKRWNKYYDKNVHRDAIREYRKKKRVLFPDYSSAQEHFCHDCKQLITDKHYKAKYCIECGNNRRKETFKKYRLSHRSKI